MEYYATVFAAAESPREPGLIWAGSDDGLVHVTRDAGATWQNVTPKGMPADALVNSIEVDPHRDGGLYVAATRYKSGDYAPYLYHTDDYGATWRSSPRASIAGISPASSAPIAIRPACCTPVRNLVCM